MPHYGNTRRAANILLAIHAGSDYEPRSKQDRQNVYSLIKNGLLRLELTPAGRANAESITPTLARRALTIDETQELEAVT